jgi:hypothetical protein
MDPVSLEVFAQPTRLGQIKLDRDQKLVFPNVGQEPAIYRFTATESNGKVSAYVGESMKLRRRFHHYRTPGPTQTTNIRLNDDYTAILGNGGTIVVDAIFAANGSDTPLDLTTQPARLLVENAWLVFLQRQGIRLKNA